MKTFGMRLRLDKCKFLQETFEYMGHVVSSQGLHTSPKKIEVIKSASTPRNVAELRSFLGIKLLWEVYCRACPLNELLWKTTTWRWTKACEDSFNKLKEALASAGVLRHYDPSEEISLACDASAQGIISHLQRGQ